MLKKYYKIELADGIEIHVYFETINGIVIRYVVKLIFRIKDVYFDTHLAATMLLNDVKTIYTYNESDFIKFKELQVVTP